VSPEILSAFVDLTFFAARLSENRFTARIFEMRPSLDARCAVAFVW
jgi:hypothetical protein